MINNLDITPLKRQDQLDFIRFTDQFIGKGYFKSENFAQQIELSSRTDLCSSFTLKNKNGLIVGIRLTYAPSLWQKQIRFQFLDQLGLRAEQVAYFKSLFIDPSYQKRGLGPLLSNKSIGTLKVMGAKYILTHSWKESPNNSSVRYLKKSDFKILGEIPHYWDNYDYLCAGCQVKPCVCTAVEMLLEI